MTEEELREEWLYRRDERLGILCGSDAPTEEQLNIATEEADAWFNQEIGILI